MLTNMLRALAALTLSALSAPALARELPRGTIELSGDSSLSASSSTVDADSDSDQSGYEIGLQASYYVARNLAVGIWGASKHTESTSATGETGSDQSFAGPLVQWSIPAGKNSMIKLAAGIAGGHAESRTPGVQLRQYDLFAEFASAGLSIWVTDSVPRFYPIADGD